MLDGAWRKYAPRLDRAGRRWRRVARRMARSLAVRPELRPEQLDLSDQPWSIRDRRVEGALPCAGCDYMLHTLELSAACPECGQPVFESVEAWRRPHDWREPDDGTLWHLSSLGRLMLLLLGVLLPLACFTMTAAPDSLDRLFKPWQSGRLDHHAILLYRGPATWPFYPLLLYAMASACAFVFKPEKAVHAPTWRVGVYTGVVLASQYTLILILAMMGAQRHAVYTAAVTTGGLGLAVLLWMGWWRLHRFWVWIWMPRHRWIKTAGWILVGGGLLALVASETVLFLFMLAPVLTLLIYLTLSIRIHRTALPATGRDKLPWKFWLPLYGVAWTASVKLMLLEYAKLPTSQPSRCYIVSAAAHGHPWLTGARRFGGRPVTRQLLVFKLFEWALAERWPCGHARLRRFYDRHGPRVAAHVQRPAMADMVYLLLKPAEYAAALTTAAMGRRRPTPRLPQAARPDRKTRSRSRLAAVTLPWPPQKTRQGQGVVRRSQGKLPAVGRASSPPTTQHATRSALRADGGQDARPTRWASERCAIMPPPPQPVTEMSDIPEELQHPNFRLSDAAGLGPDPVVRRQDPSNIVWLNGRYHVYYTRYELPNLPYDAMWRRAFLQPWVSEIWLATSEDGVTWQEQGDVFPPQEGAWCCMGRHAPHIVPHDGHYHLFFTACGGGDAMERHLGLAVADRPEGPFTLTPGPPLISPTKKPGDFDGWLMDDACVIRRDGLFWLYYKGRPLGSTHGWEDSRVGVAFADAPRGPFRRSGLGALADAHTACVWPHREGVAMIADNPPPERFCLRYAADGLHFVEAGPVGENIRDNGVDSPAALDETTNRRGITWGLALQRDENQRQYLVRFDCDLATP